MKKKIIKLAIIFIATIALLKLPLLHQTIDNQTIRFSLYDSISMDIAEKQLQTPYFIINSL